MKSQEALNILDDIPIGHLIECTHGNGVIEVFIKYDINDFYWLEVFTLDGVWQDASVTDLRMSSLAGHDTIVTDHGYALSERPGKIRMKLENQRHIK